MNLWRQILCVFMYCALAMPLRAEPGAQSLSLAEAQRLAGARSEALAIRDQDLAGAEAKYRELIGALLPHVQIAVNERIRNSKNFVDNFASGGSGGPASNSRSDRFDVALNMSQPIFSGFRDYFIARAAEAEEESLEYSRVRAAQLLDISVAESFYQVLQYTRELAELERTKEVLLERRNELDQRVRLGKSRQGEGLAADSEVADVQAMIANMQGLLDASRELLSFLTGIPAAKINPVEPEVKVIAEPLDHYLSRLEKRADILAALSHEDAAKKQSIAAEREHWPVIAAEGNYYAYESPDNDREWDVLFRMNLPVFQGGQIDARIDQSRAQLAAAGLQAQELKRTAERDVRTAWARFHSAQSEVVAHAAAVRAGEKNYSAQKQDYELGVVNNLDVLSAIRTLQNSRRNLIVAKINAAVQFLRLKSAAGEQLR